MHMTKVVFTLASMLAVAPLFAATYYVSPTGSPEASGPVASNENDTETQETFLGILLGCVK